MGRVHLVIMNCKNGHGFGGAVYKLPDQTREGAINAIEESMAPLKELYVEKGLSFSCPVCKNEQIEYTDIETPHDRRRDATEFIENIKQKQVEAARSGNPSTILFDVQGVELTVVRIPRPDALLN